MPAIENKSFKNVSILVIPADTYASEELNRSLYPVKFTRLYSASEHELGAPTHFQESMPTRTKTYLKKELTSINRYIEKNHIDFICPSTKDSAMYLMKLRDGIVCQVALPSALALSKIYSDEGRAIISRGTFGVENESDIQTASLKARYAESSKKGADNGTTLPSLPAQARYLVTCFSSLECKLLYSQVYLTKFASERLIRAVPATGRIAKKLLQYVARIQRVTMITGAWFVTATMEDNELKVRSINPFISEVMALDRARGVNLPRLTIHQLRGENVTVMPHSRPVEMIEKRSYDYVSHLAFKCVYVDLDDTLILKERVNLEIIKFLYRCFNEGKRLVLISKALTKDKKSLLKKWRLASLFDEIIWLKKGESKAAYIREKNSIFIDDSYSERVEVASKLKIPTFDPSMIEPLINNSAH